MNRSKAIIASLRLANSLRSTRSSSYRPIRTQVTHISNLPPSNPLPISNVSHSCNFNHMQKLYFSSKPHSFLQIILANDWSDELEQELQKSNSSLTHETVIYVLKKLDKDPEKASEFFNWVCKKNGFRPSSSVYSLLLRILLSKDFMKSFWINLRKMKEQGFYLDEETYMTMLGFLKREKMASDAVALTHFYNRMAAENAMDSVAKKVVDAVMYVEWSPDIERELSRMKITFSDNLVIRILKDLRNHPLKALNFFHWVGCSSSYKLNTIIYNAISRVIARHDSIEEFWSVFEEMKNAGHEMDLDTYIKISRQFQKFKMMDDAVKLYEFMMDGPYQPSVQDCSLLLRSISGGDSPDLDLVFRVAKKYESTGHSLSKAHYDGIHRSLASAGRFDEAEKIMNVMRTAGWDPDNITYSQLVFGLCKARRLDEACEVLDEMEAQGCVPDIKTWTILIQGHCNANEVDKALMCFAKMTEKNCDADADLLDVLVNGFIRQKKIDGAHKLLLEMVNIARLRPWQATYKNLIENLLENQKLEEAMFLLQMMKRQNYPPFSEPFVPYISKFGTVENAVDFLSSLSVKDYPSISAYIHVFESFIKEGRQFEAKDLLYKCPHHIRKHPSICKLFGAGKDSNDIAA